MYQTLFLIRDGYVSLQKGKQLYFDTVENFKLDGAVIPEDIQTIDYVPDNEQCAINGKFFQAYPNDFAENCLNRIDKYITAQANRNIVPDVEPTAIELKEKEIQTYQNYLDETDWYVIRYTENGKEIPEEVKTKREEAREKISELREEINILASTNE